MATVHIPTQMRELTGGLNKVQADGSTLRQVFASMDAKHPGLATRLNVDDAIAPGLAISIDGNIASRGLLSKVGPASEIHILPAIGGG